MQTNTDFNVPDIAAKYAGSIFWLFGLFTIICFAAGIYTEDYTLGIVPFGLLFSILALLNFRLVFFILLLTIPVSVETYIGSFGTDLPSEPILILLTGSIILYFVLKPQVLNTKSFRHPILIVLFLMYGWSIFVTFFSTDVILSIKYLLAKSWYLCGFFMLPILLIRNEKSVRILFWCLFIPTLGSVLFILIKHATLLFSFDNIQKAVYPVYRNHVNYAVFITMFFPFLFLAKSWYPRHYARHTVLKYAIPVFIAAIFLSYTRGAWLALIGMPFYILVLRFRLTRYILIAAGLIAILFTGYMLSNNNYLKYSPDYEHTIYHDELGEHLTSTFEMEDMSTVERFYRWIAAVKLFKEHPLVGVGPNNFVTNYKQYTVTAYETYISDNEERSTVHNYFLLLLTEQGLPALLLYVFLIVIVLLNAEQIYSLSDTENRKYIVVVTLCIMAFLLNNTLSDLVEANKVGSLFLISLGMLVNFSTGQIKIAVPENKE